MKCEGQQWEWTLVKALLVGYALLGLTVTIALPSMPLPPMQVECAVNRHLTTAPPATSISLPRGSVWLCPEHLAALYPHMVEDGVDPQGVLITCIDGQRRPIRDTVVVKDETGRLGWIGRRLNGPGDEE